MTMTRKATAALVALACGSAFAGQTGGFATTDGNITASNVKKVTAATYTEIQAAIDAARYDAAGKKVAAGAYPLHIIYTGNEDALIATIVKDHTIDANHNCPKPHWNDAYRYVEIKAFTAGITIEGANGSSANFGIPIINSSNVVIKNMKIGALGGANNDADMIRVDNSSNVWIDHNELFAVNNECNGSPDGDLTFESAIDVKKNSQNVTISYNYIHDSKKVGLDGHTQSGGTTDYQRTITYHHNIYNNVNARLPLQRGGIVHAYNNLYSKITSSGINVRASGKAIIERNWFENSLNPLTCRYDTTGCGTWYLDSNNTTSAASNATYGITWDNDNGAAGTLNADTWTSTLTSKPSLTYTYEPVSAQCVKDKLASYAGVGKNGAVLTASACGSSAASSSAASSKASSSAAASSAASSKASSSAAASSAASSKASSSAAASSAASSKASSSSSSSASNAPTLSGTGDYPTGFSKCADLGDTCTVPSGTGWVAFGRKGSWVVKNVGVGKSVACTVAAFGKDPGGDPNKCSYQK